MPDLPAKAEPAVYKGPCGQSCARIPLRARVFIDGEWRSCRVVSISTDKARLIVAKLGPLPGELPDELALELGACGTYHGRAVWAHGREIGVRFHCQPAEIAETLIALAMYG